MDRTSSRLHDALQMSQLAIELRWERLRSGHPEATDEELDAMVRSWLTAGDMEDWVGPHFRRVSWPRR